MTQNLFSIVMGDPSADGHGMTEKVTVKCNQTLGRVEQAYKKGVKTIGVDLEGSVADEYEDSSIKEADFDKFTQAGFSVEDPRLDSFIGGWEQSALDEEIAEEGQLNLEPDLYLSLYLFTALVGDPGITFEKSESNEKVLDIGGYGLFVL